MISIKRLFLCIKKDRKELVRSKKNIICILVLLMCASFVMLSTLFLPTLLSHAEMFEGLFNKDTSVVEFFNKFFPSDLRQNIGIFASDIGLFYSLVAILFTYNILPEEITTGKMIPVICAGYKKAEILISKQLVYSMMLSAPVFMIYMSYYYVGCKLLVGHYEVIAAITNAFAISISEFFVINTTIALSIIINSKTTVLITMASLVMSLPDILFYLNCGHYFPTFLLTFAYNSMDNYKLLILPIVLAFLILIFLDYCGLQFKMEMKFDDRR